jgi:MoaA/NifB/PqqE/SkfB family radical SAM enzyme
MAFIRSGMPGSFIIACIGFTRDEWVKMNLEENNSPQFAGKLWIYTNYHCNLSCSYCVAESHPAAAKRLIRLDTVQRLVDEAAELGFSCVFFTGGEPLLAEEIYPMLAYASARLPTVLLTNAMLLQGSRLEKLKAVNHPQLVIQVSLDGGRAEQHDSYRGQGSWDRTVLGLHTLLENGFNVRISTTETSANSPHLAELCDFHLSLGIPEEDHFIRPLARRGFSQEGIEVGLQNLAPEITANVDGIYWHPLATGEDMLVTTHLFPLSQAVKIVVEQMQNLARQEEAPLKTFT